MEFLKFKYLTNIHNSSPITFIIGWKIYYLLEKIMIRINGKTIDYSKPSGTINGVLFTYEGKVPCTVSVFSAADESTLSFVFSVDEKTCRLTLTCKSPLTAPNGAFEVDGCVFYAHVNGMAAVFPGIGSRTRQIDLMKNGIITFRNLGNLRFPYPPSDIK